MIVLDEHFPENQRQLLRSWRISIRQIGFDVGRAGMDDDEIIPFLRTLRRPTFLTRDHGFYKHNLCHPRYCIVQLQVGQYESASFARRVLGHAALDTEAKRLGKVVRAFHAGLAFYKVNEHDEEYLTWRQ